MSSAPTQPLRDNERSSINLVSILTVAVAIALALFFGFGLTTTDGETNTNTPANLFGLRRFTPSFWASGSRRQLSSVATATAAVDSTKFTPKSSVVSGDKMKTPVYFLSHGGVCPSSNNLHPRLLVLTRPRLTELKPNIMYDVDHPAYKELGKIGREITTKVKPRAVVVFSAHWQAGRDTVQVNTAEMTELIYE
jgi:hypothetical protein